jgi:hypothetical protein
MRSSCAPSPARARRFKWNSPFYGVEDEARAGSSAFIASRSTKVAFFPRRPVPLSESKHKDVRYIHEDDHLDEAQFAVWVKQVSQLPGERM